MTNKYNRQQNSFTFFLPRIWMRFFVIAAVIVCLEDAFSLRKRVYLFAFGVNKAQIVHNTFW